MKNDRSGAVSQAINGCAVHNSGQLCLFGQKWSRLQDIYHIESRVTIRTWCKCGNFVGEILINPWVTLPSKKAQITHSIILMLPLEFPHLQAIWVARNRKHRFVA
jgi:hypothetical protein